MTPMLEKVARDVNDGMPKLGKWETLTPEMKAECIDVVRRVVRALREPTDAMLDKMSDLPIDGPDYGRFWPSLHDCGELWKCAIDSILADTGDGE